MWISLLLYVALLGYLCAPDVIIFLPKRLTDDVRNFLHSIIFFVVLVVSMFILLFIQTIETKQYLIHTSDVGGSSENESIPVSSTTSSIPIRSRQSALQKAVMFPMAMQATAAPPPVPDVPVIPTGNWTWPTVTIVPSTSPMPPHPDTNFPSHLPPIVPKTWDSWSPSEYSASAPDDSGSGSGIDGSASPDMCVTIASRQTRECIPLPSLAQPLPKTTTPSPLKKDEEEEDSSWIPMVVQTVNQYNKMAPTSTTTYSTPDWVQFFRKFSRQDNLSSLLEKSSKDSNKLIQVMTRLTQFKDAKDSAGAENYVNQQAV